MGGGVEDRREAGVAAFGERTCGGLEGEIRPAKMGPFHVEFASVGEVHGELGGCHDVTVG